MTKEELAEITEMVTKAAEGIESRLADSLKNAIEGFNSKAAAATELQSKSEAALKVLPDLIQKQVESQLKTNLTGIVDEIGKQFEAKVKEASGNSEAPEGGLNIPYLLDNSDKLIAIFNAWKQPTTEQAMLSQMNFVMKWHSLLTKLEKGGGTADEATKAIASTFTPQE